MPFKSKAQQRFMFAAEERGELPKGKALGWAHETKNIKKLPERKKTAEQIADAVMEKVAAPRWLVEASRNPGLLYSEQAARVGVNESARKMLTPMRRMSEHFNTLRHPPDLNDLPRPLTTHAERLVRQGPEGVEAASKDGIRKERGMLRKDREYRLRGEDVPIESDIVKSRDDAYRAGAHWEHPPVSLSSLFSNPLGEMTGTNPIKSTFVDKIKWLLNPK
jgi:hypothetical protein